MRVRPKEHPVKAVLQEYGVSQLELSFVLGISQGAVSQILCGWRQPDPKVQQRLDEFVRELTKPATGRKAA